MFFYIYIYIYTISIYMHIHIYIYIAFFQYIYIKSKIKLNIRFRRGKINCSTQSWKSTKSVAAFPCSWGPPCPGLPGRAGSSAPLLDQGHQARLQGNTATKRFSFLHTYLFLLLALLYWTWRATGLSHKRKYKSGLNIGLSDNIR